MPLMVNFFKRATKPLRTLGAAQVSFETATKTVSPIELRRKVPIVAIDDLSFPPEKNLTNSGFIIETRTDIQRIEEVEKYQIILCDVNGVGVALSADTQGAYVIEEIKATFPDKIVVAYTAGSTNSRLVLRAKGAADFYLKKDASVEEWRDLLDGVIKDLTNPIEVWKRTRIRLLTAGIELEDLMRLEQALLENLQNGKSSVKAALNQEVEAAGAASWKGEVARFLLSKAFDFAFDAVTT